jgi:quercetin dioxygenase-like cupin family protein
MKNYNLNELISFSQEGPIKKHFLNSKGFHQALICLKKGVEIPVHPEAYAVSLIVLKGRGMFTDSNGESALSEMQGIFIQKDEIRGIRAEEDLVVLGVQDRGKGDSQE